MKPRTLNPLTLLAYAILLPTITTSLLLTTPLRCSTPTSTSTSNTFRSSKKGKVLILGGSGFLGSNVAKRAILEGYQVTSLSRRGKEGTTSSDGNSSFSSDIDYKSGDARDPTVIADILSQGGYIAVIHCIGLLFDSSSGLGRFNRLVSGSGSVPEENSTYDDITRLTAFNSIMETEKYASARNQKIAFIFTSAAEANWPNVGGGSFIEQNLAPDWLKRYLVAKRAVEDRLRSTDDKLIRPVIFRPSLIYSLEKLPSLPAVFGFYVGNKAGLPFVDRPVTVQTLSMAMVKSIEDESASGVQSYKEIEKLAR